ncbi:MAG: hypothetical protein JNJ51_08430 [Methylobacillus glycogenes]|nr:hypothetical protein [Methylobacillus glycogenes]
MEKTEEQIASENQLLALADQEQPAAEPQASEAGQGQAGQVEFSAEQSLIGLLQIGHLALLAGGMKNTAKVWDADGCSAFAGAVVPVLRKYPWGGKVLAFLETGAGVEEMALFAVVAPLTMATVGAVQQDKAEMRKEKPVEAQPVAPAGQKPAGECAADEDAILP